MKFLKIVLVSCLVSLFLLQSCKDSGNTPTNSDIPTNDIRATGIDSVDYWLTQAQADPQNAQKRFKLGEAYYEAGGFDQAIVNLQQAIALDSTQPAYFHLLADTYLDYHDKSFDALTTMQRAAGIFPDKIPTLLKLSKFQLILKQYGRSVETIKQIVAIEPFNPEAFFMMGMNYKEMGDTSKAINSFQTCVEQDADHLDAYLNLALLCDATGRDEFALKYYDNAIDIDTLNVNTYYLKAMFFQRRFRDNEAIEVYEKIHRVDRDFPQAYFNKGAIYYDYRKKGEEYLEKAYYNFDLAIKVEPTYALAYFWRGIVQEEQGKIDAAKRDYEQALVFDENFTIAQERLDALVK